MTEDAITRKEHEEFVKRIEAEDQRQNKRIEVIEDNISQIITRQITTLTSMIEKTALTVDSIQQEQERQGKRLATLEGKDGDMWRTSIKYIIAAITGGVIAFALAQIGM